jgi:membrane protease YdiL (CAAX protease family)
MPFVTLVTCASAVCLALLLHGARIGPRLALCRPSSLHAVLTLLLVTPLAIVVQEMANWAAEFLPAFNGEMYTEFAQAPWIVVLVGGSLLPAIGEEIFFRGVLGRGLVARYGLAWGTLWCSLLFAVIHLDPAQMVGVLGIGVALQLLLMATRSIWLPMLLHGANNALSFVLLKLGWHGEVEHQPLALVAAAALALVPLALLFYQTRTQWVLPNGEDWSPGFLSAESPPSLLGARQQRAKPGLVLATIAMLALALFAALLVYFADTI